MSYKTIIMCAAIGGAMQYAWSMERPEDMQSQSGRSKCAGYAELMRVQRDCASAGIMVMPSNKNEEFKVIIPKVLDFKKTVASRAKEDGDAFSNEAYALAEELSAALTAYKTVSHNSNGDNQD